MKKIIILTAVLLCLSAAHAQNSSFDNNDRHRIFAYYSFGYANNIYDRINNAFIHKNYAVSSAIEAKYAYFFDKNWGLSLGLGLSCFAAKGTMNISGDIKHYNDPAFSEYNPWGERQYDLYYTTKDLTEKQRIWALEIPLQGHFEHFFNSKYGIFASLGARAYLPIISARSTFSQGEMIITGHEAFHNDWYTDPPHFGKQNFGSTPAKASLRWSIDAIADFGGLLRLSPVYDLYVGVYGSYGFMDVLPKAVNKKNLITPEHNNPLVVNSLLATNFLGEYNKYIKDNHLDWKTVGEKWNRWQVGIKLGLHIKPCKIGKISKDKNLRETQKEFYAKLPEYMSNAGKTVVIRDTIHVIYVYNTPPDNNDFTQEEKDNISALVEIFSNSKILFDLNSDIPKIENKNFIAEAAKVLQKGTSLSLIIEGYTCDLGTEAHNRDLAARRANAIRDLFVAQGVSPSQIQVAAYTAKDPQSKLNIIEECREEHRAVIFKIVKR